MANQGGPGANVAAADKWLQEQMTKEGAQPNGKQPSIFDGMPAGKLKEASDVTHKETSNTSDAFKPDSGLATFGKSFLAGVQTSILDPVARLQSQVFNYLSHPEALQTIDAGKITPQQKEAAKLIGADVGDNWGKILKMSPEDLEKFRSSSEEAFGFNQDEQKARDAAIAAGKEYSGPMEGLLQHSALKDLLGYVYNPNESNTKLYQKVNEVVKLQDMVTNPSKYDPKQVVAAQKILTAYKTQSAEGLGTKVKEGLKGAIQNPLGTLNALLADPELALAPELKLGQAGYAAKIAEGTEVAAKATQAAELASKIKGVASAMPDIAEAAGQAAKGYEETAKTAMEGANNVALKKYATSVASSGVAGSGINTGISAMQQKEEQGYVQRGSLPSAAIQGAAIGAGLSSLGGRDNVRAEFEKHIQESGTREAGNNNPQTDTHGNPATQNEGKKPGEPLSPDTPINKSGTVPYYGGVDSNGKVIHLDKNTPDVVQYKDRSGKQVNIPVKKTVAYHEATEYPLMHMEGPIESDTLAKLKEKIAGQGTLSKEVEGKLVKGESLSYPEAHEIATWAENNMVHQLYDVDPKVYQKGLKPYIKDVGNAAEKAPASSIPETLDTKPYDDMNHPENLKGRGKRPVVDAIKGGAKTAAVLGGGAAAGAYLSDKDQKGKGALGGSLAMFLGKLARTHDFAAQELAEGMERAGKTPEEIHQQTGMFKSINGQWLHEISDLGMDFDRAKLAETEKTGKAVPLFDVLKHPELEKAYGHILGRVKVRQQSMEGLGGYYNPHDKVLTLNDPKYLDKLAKRHKDEGLKPESIFAHETQHAIQHAEGLPTGDSPQRHLRNLEINKQFMEDNLSEYQNVVSKLRDMGKHSLADSYMVKANELRKDISSRYTPRAMQEEAQRRYRASAGEQEAFNVQDRFNMTPEERAKSFPPSTMTLPYEDQNVRYNSESFHVLPNISSLKDNYTKPLSAYSDTMYHDTGMDDLFYIVPKGRSTTNVGDLYVSNSPDLATGQHGRSGVMVQFDASKLKGQINKEKPTWEYSWDRGQGEFITRHMRGIDYRNAVKGFTIQPDARISKVQRMQLHNLEVDLLREGWKKIENGDGSTTYQKPSVGTPTSQQGFVTFDQAKRLALLASGGLAGYAMASDQHKLAGAIKGSLAGLILGNATWKGTQNLIARLKEADTQPRVSSVLDGLEASRQIANRHLFATSQAIRSTVPDPVRRTAIAHWLEGDRTITLSSEEKKAALQTRLEFDSLLSQAQQLGIIKQGLADYVTHIYSKDPVTQSLLEQYKASNVKQSTKYGLQRKGPPTLKAALKAGLKVTTDISDILDHYGEDLNTAIHSKIAINALKKMDDGKGTPLVIGAAKAPGHYVTNDHPALRGLKIHPAIATEMSHVFDVYRPGIVAGSYDALNNAVRRVKLSFSLFHAKNLADVAMGMKSNPLANLADVGKSAVGKSRAHEMIKNPVPGDVIDQMIKGGAVGEFSPRPSGNMDEGRPMEATLDAIGDSLDKIFPGLGKLTEPVKTLDQATQKLLWKNVWTGLKASAIEAKFNTLKKNWAAEVSKNPQAKMPSDDNLWKVASSFGNNTFGGLNWRRIANEVKNKYLRELTMSSFAPPGRRKLGVLMLAPDFTASTMRHIIKMYGEGTGIKGVFSPRTLADLHRQWFIKSALYYMVVGNAMNYALSGHFMWDNKDPFMIDMGDGRKMQWSKVLTDPFRIAMHPGQEAVNKLNPLVQEGLDQALNTQYLSAGGHAPRMEGMPAHLAHAAQLFDPIQSSQIGQAGWSSLIYGTAGTPVYGETDKMRQERKEQGIEKRRQERRNHPRRSGWKTHY